MHFIITVFGIYLSGHLEFTINIMFPSNTEPFEYNSSFTEYPQIECHFKGLSQYEKNT